MESATTWIFTRGSESVRISRLALGQGRWCLSVDGPGPAHRLVPCVDLLDTVAQQADEERRLVAEGFRFDQLLTASLH